ncbi:MAG: hypothetical protein M0026_08430 [Nocardiopsaceae bacterium]|nr:hypothetical protein [Nocardiopsaceae bacterium]
MANQRSRRVILPGADELFFRPSEPAGPEPAPRLDDSPAAPAAQPAPAKSRTRVRQTRAPRSSGRQRHDEKITVYISAPELLALEQARLTLRADHGLTADRGRIVREAVAVLLADFEEYGDSSMLVQRLTGE